LVFSNTDTIDFVTSLFANKFPAEIILSPTASLQIPRELFPEWIAVCPFESIINTCLYSKC